MSPSGSTLVEIGSRFNPSRYFASSAVRKSSASFRGGKKIWPGAADPHTDEVTPVSIAVMTRATASAWGQRFTRYRSYSCVQTTSPSPSTYVAIGARRRPSRYLASSCARKSSDSFRGGNDTVPGLTGPLGGVGRFGVGDGA